MSTTKKLLLGFGILTTLLLLFGIALTMRLRSIESSVEHQANIARPRSVETSELENNVLGFALAVRTFAQTGDTTFLQEANEKAAKVDQHLAEYERLSATAEQRGLASAFSDRWLRFREDGRTFLEAGQSPHTASDWQRLANRRVELENFIDDQMKTEAGDAYNSRLETTFDGLRAIPKFTVILLAAFFVIATMTSSMVGRSILLTERSVHEKAELLRTTLASIGDAVITTDNKGNIDFLNQVAQDLTGWSLAEAEGRNAGDIFRIVNETTRKPVASPVDKVLDEGITVGLENHTVLLTKTGGEIPIDDSAAPIRDGRGSILGVVLVFRDITERRRTEEAGVRLAAIVESSDDAIIGKDLNGVITSWNSGAERHFGYTEGEAIGQPISMLIPADRLDEEPGILDRIRRGVRVAPYETLRRRKDGSLLHVSLTVSPIVNSHGEVVGASKIARDITGRKEAAEALQISEERFRSVFAAAPMAIFVCDRDAVIQHYNAHAVGLWGREPTCGVERHCGSMKLWLPNGEFLPHRQSPMVEVLRTGIPALNVEVFIERPDGSRLPVLVNFAALKDREGNITGAITSFIDITERKRAEDALRDSEELFAKAFNSSPLALTVTSLKTEEFIMVNETFVTVTGFGREESIGRTTLELGLWQNPADREAELALAKSQERIRSREYRFRTKDGREIVGLLSAELLEIGGEPCALTVIQDITERKQAETEIEALSDYNRNVLESIADPLFTLDREWRFTYMSRQGEQLVMRERDELLGKYLWEEFPGLIGGPFEDVYRRAMNEGIAGRITDFYPDHQYWYEVNIFPAPNGVTVYFRNVTERIQRELDLAFLADLSKDFMRISSADEIMKIAGERIAEYLKLAHCTFTDINETADEAYIIYDHHDAGSQNLVGKYRLTEFLDEESERQQLAAGKANVVNNVRDEPRPPEAAARFEALNVRAHVLAPYIRDGHWKFALGVHHSQPHQWREDEIVLVRELATRIYVRLERVHAEEQLRESELNFRSLANSISQLAWMTDAEGYIFWYNERWFEYTGTTLEEMQGWGWQAVHQPSAVKRVTAKFKRHIASGREWEDTFLLRSKSGEYRWFLSRAAPIRDEQGKIVRWFGTNTDIDDVRRAEDILQRSRDELETRVAERTSELAEANKNLKEENARRLLVEKEAVRLLRQIVTVQEQERSRIARDLHDELGQQMTALRLKLESVKEICNEELVCDEIDATQAMAERIDADVGFLAWEMRPPALTATGLPATLKSYVKEWSRFSSVSTELQARGFGKARLTPDMEINLYRIVQEGLNNAHKYANAKNVSIILEKRKDDISLIIEDDGIGFNPNKKNNGKKGLGLIGMRERAMLLGGNLEIESSPGNGTTLFVHVPLAENGETGRSEATE